ncbi:MAG TPA: efflux RND transporter permease subunit [Xanthobacteraceae bacterium]
MSISTPFIRRPVATTLLTFGVAAAGAISFFLLPVSPLPQVDYPTISVRASLPGASPEVVATTVATPLERHLGQIADVTEMTSSSAVGGTRITLQFGLDRNIDGAARDVQAAINAARVDLPASLRQNPTYKKVNPADAPIMILALTSEILTRGDMYDQATTVLAQRLSQVDGVGEVVVSGSALPAVRAELNPSAMFKYGIGLEDVRAALSSANAHAPKGSIDVGRERYQIYDNDQASKADQYRNLIVAYRNGAAVRLADLGEVVDSVENLRNAGLANNKPAVLIILYRQPGANIIDTVDNVRRLLPELEASIPSTIDVSIANDRSTTIRSSLHDVEATLVIAIILVVLVVFAFLRDPWATLVPSLAVPISLLGTFGFMYLLGFSLNNLSLMALTIATGFVVDDAIVVVENITRHIEAGMSRLEAALLGAREVSFTVLSMSLSLIAVFIPILLMAGIVGRLFREFALTLSIAILVSLVVSLTTTPMLCAFVLGRGPRRHGRLYRASERVFDAMLRAYDRTLSVALRHPAMVILVLFVTVGLNVVLFLTIPRGFFPQQDTGRLIGRIQADQSISFQSMQKKLTQFMQIARKDPAIDSIVGFTGGGQTNSGFTFASLKPRKQRDPISRVVARLARETSQVPGANMFFVAVQDIRVGGRQSAAEFEYTLQADDLALLYKWAPKIKDALDKLPELNSVNSDQQNKGLETDIVIDRPTAARLGISVSQIDNTLYDAFGQRQVSTIYSARNQYHVIMEVAPQFWQQPETLKDIYVSTSGGSVGGTQSTNAVAGTVVSSKVQSTTAAIAADTARNLANNAIANSGRGATSTGAAVSTARETMVPLAAVTHFGPGETPLAVNHQGPFVATTISFNLNPGYSLSDATAAISSAMLQIGAPAAIHGSFQGTARQFEASLANEKFLIMAAFIAVYIVLGMLYESFVHPVTILSTLPSAGVGAVMALMFFHTEFSLIALIGVILLIGIVKKNAIMMIDFALDAERTLHLPTREAIYQACILRFRPIMMTTMAAMLGAVPLIVSTGEGSELRQPLGIVIVGGLLMSQLLTLYTTPVIYIYFDRLRLWGSRLWRPRAPSAQPAE